jgi:putative ATP-dependent endonuclease of the OLD family
MPILVEKVRINNFRSLKAIEVKLEPLTLLVGANNAGKTSFLRALNLALGIERKSVTKEDLFINQHGEVTDKTIIIDVKIIPTNEHGIRIDEFDDDWLREFSGITNETEGNQSFVAFRTKYAFDGNSEDAKSEKFVIRSTWNSPNINESTDILPSASLKNIPLYFIDAQRDIIDDLKNKTSYFGKLSDKIDYDEVAKSKLEGDLKTLNEYAVRNSKVMSHVKTNLENLNSTLRSGGSGVEITPFPKKVRDLHKSIKVHFQDANSDTFELDYHGMGTRSWASLLAFKAYVSWENSVENTKRRNPFYPILALEEPEAHLHPNAQRQLYKQLKSIAGQKIISTHSPYIVGLADLEEIRYFCRKGDTAEVKAIDISTFTADEERKAKREILHSKGELVFSKLVVLCEGETEEQFLPILAAEYLGCEPFEEGINFIGCGGSNFKMFIKIFQALDIKWIVFSDYDNPETKGHVNKAFSENILDIQTSIENQILITIDETIEKYLIRTSRNEMIGACSEFINEYMTSNETTKNNFQTQINTPNTTGHIDKVNDGLCKFMEWDKMKAKLAPYYAESMLNITDENRRYPPKIKDLFEAIKIKLGI